ncbi:MAG: Hsp70 family protein, partial [Patescibacteria group bacterium]
IPPAPRGIPQIEVTFDIDANGILNVKAVDKGTGKQQHITITSSSGLSKDEIERMKKDAEAHAAEDLKKKEVIDLKNQAESLIFTTEKTLKDAGDKVNADTRKEIMDKVEDLKTAKNSDDKDLIKKNYDTLSEAIQKVGASMYQQVPNPEPAQEQPKGPVEGEYEEVKK